jgi:hypothetical protein
MEEKRLDTNSGFMGPQNLCRYELKMTFTDAMSKNTLNYSQWRFRSLTWWPRVCWKHTQMGTNCKRLYVYTRGFCTGLLVVIESIHNLQGSHVWCLVLHWTGQQMSTLYLARVWHLRIRANRCLTLTNSQHAKEVRISLIHDHEVDEELPKTK